MKEKVWLQLTLQCKTLAIDIKGSLTGFNYTSERQTGVFHWSGQWRCPERSSTVHWTCLFHSAPPRNIYSEGIIQLTHSQSISHRVSGSL